MFDRWCLLKGIPHLPALPATVAAFVTDCSCLGAERIWQALQEVSLAHVSAGYADPTLGPPVSDAMNAASQIEPPRSWAKEERQAFMTLPYPLQKYVHKREEDRDRALRQALNTVHNGKNNDGIQSHAAA